ncbi:uncharacterized protein LAESUDRAFT_758605 [Laetiporus sulphureus 93-53]|uniref:N-acetyltransferase domain-containing protein n=1 Tax=Laetiporus sulphureus 93-53 TaxID=1314785 RepID=A0A165EJK5_9APHY|nr:uncharacterized protein LAESUDRAFT_758605 [Laetiporus sulphureus 93-53]KZT07185.1 hypothetical protein LAESUDRAFT_758605 [Laetiporus sulphureus 93-53]
MRGVLQLHELKSTQDATEMLPRVLNLSNIIFAPEPGSKYASIAVWKERLPLPDAKILYMAPSSDPSNPIAFVFAHPRTHPLPLKFSETESLHVWLAGVLPARRKEGCLSRMMAALEAESAVTLTVCTTPDKYPDMWAWLNGRGWSVERELGRGKVMLSKYPSFAPSARTQHED